MAKHEVCPQDDIPVGEKKPFNVDGQDILVFHLEDGFYATQTNCTHLFWPLKNGKLFDQHKIQCPFHRAEFDIRTGEVIKWANFPPGVQLLNAVRKEKALQTFKVTVEEGKVFVEV